ncbi:thioesterase [Aquimarina sp. AD10]|uniref:Thioesterase n=1 Tax=Aquimarina aggregata TaxID=1642818 RepID=A0A162YJK1_9FLAO|nr:MULTISPECIES: thioesterase family protein [Aquimarina]AXT61078.1 thioesterase [Aquimarina sp. AD10]KZS39176.1 hypothetical protein AWE51_11510 [Aquimarina aggregata]RKM92747.1 thioesterase [Aquimarina sp. AD10]
MYRKTYKVLGNDVNDYMIMENHAYFSYASRLLDNFLFEKGYSKQKLISLAIGFQKCTEELLFQKHLMFTQRFFVNFECIEITDNRQKIRVKNSFFNEYNELCAIVITKLNWCDINNHKTITPPRKILEPFFAQQLRLNVHKNISLNIVKD